MKPRITLAETALTDGSPLTLQEHDGRHYLLVHGQQICGPATAAAEKELAYLAAAPFRPARQPKVLLIGLGLGHTLEAITTQLTQKKGTFIVAEPLYELVQWNRQFLPVGPLTSDARVSVEEDPGPAALGRYRGELHAILLHLDAAPVGPRNRPWVDDRRWLSAAYEALQPGGQLAIAGSRYVPNLSRRLQQSGFDVAEHTVPASPNAKRPKLHPIWLARKGQPLA